MIKKVGPIILITLIILLALEIGVIFSWGLNLKIQNDIETIRELDFGNL